MGDFFMPYPFEWKARVTPVPVPITEVKLFSADELPGANWWVQVAAESFFIESLIQK